ncbi:MAG TPA: DUF559 domain-containing protein [Mycobacteriales bacterium]|nr:DUF559 domain-containing protein [Mycobacteriales bacterium]
MVVADALANDGLVSGEDLAAYAMDHRPLRNIRTLDRAIALIDPLAESPMETRLRLLLISAGLPRPVSQHVVRDDLGGFVARLDLAFPAQRVAIEYDGAFHWNQRRADDRRRDAIRALGWMVLVVSAEDYYRTPAAIVSAVRDAIAHRG